ncbi:MAG: hypothetical protein RSF82_12200, partial [Angelakisella sp.]
MMTITEKVAYLKGMADGMRLDESANEGKLLKTVIDVLEDMALTISDVEDTIGEMSQQVDEIDDDLAAIEEDWYDEDEDEDDEDVRYEVECPVCGNVINVDEDLLEEGAIDCPNCGENLEFDFDEDDEDEDEECGCGCNCEC